MTVEQSTFVFINIVSLAAKFSSPALATQWKVWLRSPHRGGERDEKVTCCDVPAGMEYQQEMFLVYITDLTWDLYAFGLVA